MLWEYMKKDLVCQWNFRHKIGDAVSVMMVWAENRGYSQRSPPTFDITYREV